MAGTKKKFSEEEEKEILKLYKAGFSYSEVAQKTGASLSKVYNTISEAGKLKAQTVDKKLQEKIFKTYKKHKSVAITSRVLKLTYQKCYYHLDKARKLKKYRRGKQKKKGVSKC